MLSDEVLFERLKGGDLTAFDALYERYSRHLFGFICKHLSDRTEAEDVLHDAFVAVLRKGKGGQEVCCFRAWLFQVARNLCLNRLRGQERAGRALGAVKQKQEAAAAPAERELELHQAHQRLRRAVARLPGHLAELFQLRAGGLSYQELALVLEVPVGTVKSRMHELVDRLRTEVRQ
jgi:RNA polymerase sigma factor (sigma-70 family)